MKPPRKSAASASEEGADRVGPQVTESDVFDANLGPKPVAVLHALFSTEGIRQEQRLLLRPGETAIGREVPGEHDIRLAGDAKASRIHAVLIVSEDKSRAELADRDSRNGTFINGREITRQPLADGDVIRIGSSLFLFRNEEADPPDIPLTGVIGASVPMRRLRQLIARVASSDLRVLITGETGSGKEVVARTLHQASDRRGRPFVAVNCAAIPAALAESLLFGHAGHSFSGSGAQARHGFFRVADTGTLFLDELGELPLELQPKLLRALEERCYYPVGETRSVAYDVRIVSATNRDLTAEVTKARFRADLFARLHGTEIHIPPLRERREDILLLLAHFFGKERPKLSPRLAEALLLHDWPLNVRELSQTVEHLRVVGADAPILDLDLLAGRLSTSVAPSVASESRPTALPEPAVEALKVRAASPGIPSGNAQAAVPEAETLRQALARNKGNIRRAALALGASRYQLYRWMKQYGLDPEMYRSSLEDDGASE